MSAGGHSFHKKQWLETAAAAALAATGAGAAGIGPMAGPMAGLLGSGGAAATAGGLGTFGAADPAAMAGLTGGDAAGGLGLLGSSDPAEMAGMAGAQGVRDAAASPTLMSQIAPYAQRAGKFASIAKTVGLLQPQQQMVAPSPRPQMQPAQNTIAYPQQPQALNLADPKLKALLALLQQQQGTNFSQV